MLNIDFTQLKKIATDKNAEIRCSSASKECIDNINKLINNLNETLSNLNEGECSMAIMSLQNWIVRRNFSDCKVEPRIGDIFFADLGTSYKPEFAYPHTVLVIEKIGFYYLVIPTSTSQKNIDETYHPINNINGNKYMRLIYGIDTDKTDGFEKTCALLLSNVKTISGGRFIGKKGRITNLKLFDEIKETLFNYLFPRHKIRMDKLKQQIEIFNEAATNTSMNKEKNKENISICEKQLTILR